MNCPYCNKKTIQSKGFKHHCLSCGFDWTACASVSEERAKWESFDYFVIQKAKWLYNKPKTACNAPWG